MMGMGFFRNPHCRSGRRLWLKVGKSTIAPEEMRFACGDIYRRKKLTRRGVLYQRLDITDIRWAN